MIWKPQVPPPDFAERVIARIHAEESAAGNETMTQHTHPPAHTDAQSATVSVATYPVHPNIPMPAPPQLVLPPAQLRPSGAQAIIYVPQHVPQPASTPSTTWWGKATSAAAGTLLAATCIAGITYGISAKTHFEQVSRESIQQAKVISEQSRWLREQEAALKEQNTKLKEQGTVIEEQNKALASAKSDVAKLQDELKSLSTKVNAAANAARTANAEMKKTIGEIQSLTEDARITAATILASTPASPVEPPKRASSEGGLPIGSRDSTKPPRSYQAGGANP